MTGLVIKNTGYWYTVLTDDGATIDCKVKGNFRLKGIRSTNPVAVGDRVVFEVIGNRNQEIGNRKQEIGNRNQEIGNRKQEIGDMSDSPKADKGNLLFPVSYSLLPKTGWIVGIEDRKNYIIRKASNLSKQSSIIACNVDQAMLIVTVNYPETSTTFIDRFLASAEAYRVPVILIFNKTDLLSEEELHYQQMMQTLYETIGYKTIAISATTGAGIPELRKMMEGKITLFSGNSGVGKSTIINAIVPDAHLRTAEISEAHNQGTHTTTFSEMIPVTEVIGNRKEKIEDMSDSPKADKGNLLSPISHYLLPKTWLIDTPGIRGFGTFDIEKTELTSYFKDIFRFSKDCRFSDCTHTHEPGCAVLKAVENHYIAASRYQSYLSMLEDQDDGKYRAAY